MASSKGWSRTLAASEMKLFVTTVDSCQPLNFARKSSILYAFGRGHLKGTI